MVTPTDNPKSGKPIKSNGVEITGTPLQLGMIFEVLDSKYDVKVDIPGTSEESAETLKNARVP